MALPHRYQSSTPLKPSGTIFVSEKSSNLDPEALSPAVSTVGTSQGADPQESPNLSEEWDSNALPVAAAPVPAGVGTAEHQPLLVMVYGCC